LAYTLISTTVGSEHIFAFRLGKYTLPEAYIRSL
jgi:hypothetical protein